MSPQLASKASPTTASSSGPSYDAAASSTSPTADDVEPDPLLRPATSAAPVEPEIEESEEQDAGANDGTARPRRMSQRSTSTTTAPQGVVTAAAASHTPTGLEFAYLFATRFWTLGTTNKPAIIATLFCADFAWIIKALARITGLHSKEVQEGGAKNKQAPSTTTRDIGTHSETTSTPQDVDIWQPRHFAPTSRGLSSIFVSMLVAAHTQIRTWLERVIDAPLTLPRAHVDFYGPPRGAAPQILSKIGDDTSNKNTSKSTNDASASSTRKDAAANMSKPWTRSPKLTGLKPPMPECWGHRGASAAFPENTIASFEMAIRDGAEGLESDVHITSDDVVIMFHDPSLERTTDGRGLIREQPWHDNIDQVRTKAAPHQQIPTFHQVCELLMRPENRHVKLNIDIKPENDPERLFRLMRRSVESFPNFAEDLSPRLILGLWHPVFLRAALKYVPTLRRVHIGGSPVVARTYFWKHCDGFSMWFPSLVGADGQNFLEQARREGKDVFVWTVNRRDEMIEATRWGVKAILTDETAMMQSMRKEMNSDYATTRSERVGMFFRWATWRYWMLPQFLIQAVWISELEKRAGITFKQAWKDDGLQSNDPTTTGAEGLSEDTSAASSDATLANNDSMAAAGTSTLVGEKDALAHDTRQQEHQQPVALPAVVAAV